MTAFPFCAESNRFPKHLKKILSKQNQASKQFSSKATLISTLDLLVVERF